MKTNLMKYLFAVTFAAASINATPNLKPQMPMPSVINPVSTPAQTPIPNAADSITATKNEQRAPRNLSALYAFSPALLAAGPSVVKDVLQPSVLRFNNILDTYVSDNVINATFWALFASSLTALCIMPIVAAQAVLIDKLRKRSELLVDWHNAQLAEMLEKFKAELKRESNQSCWFISWRQ